MNDGSAYFAGNFGIGTDNPSQQLTIKRSGGQTQVSLISDTNQSGAIYFGDTGSIPRGVIEYDHPGDLFRFYTAGQERMRIDDSGRVAIGTLTTTSVNTNGFVINPIGNGANIPFFGNGGASTSNSHISFGLYSTTAVNYRFYVGYGGTVYARSTTIAGLSDEREKQNIRNLDTGLAEILQLQPRRFDWRDGSGTDIPGFVAQEVEGIFPELIEDYHKTESETRKALRMGDILPTLVNAIKELSAKVETLETEVAALKAS